MAPNLRSTSRATSNNSRPSTPMTAPLAGDSFSFMDSTRPRKQRRTGRNSRIGMNTLQDVDNSREGTAESSVRQSQHTSENTEPVHQEQGKSQCQLQGSQSHAGTTVSDFLSEPSLTNSWNEPPLRSAQPSYRDTPWSNVSTDRNPVLSTMRPLGAMPTAADRRKVGLTAPPKVTNSKGAKAPAASQENHVDPAPVAAPVLPERLSDLSSLPLPTSSEHDIERMKIVVEHAVRYAEESGNRGVALGLRGLWIKGASDPFMLDILSSVIRRESVPSQKAVFKTVMRTAFKSVETEETIPAPITRTHSAESTSSLSSAKSLDVDQNRPRRTSGPVNRGRKRGRNSETSPAAGPTNDNAVSQERPLEEAPSGVEEAQAAKRSRLHIEYPVQESQIRSSLGLGTDSASPVGHDKDNFLATANGEISHVSSFARDEALENNDTCRQCGGNGQLLCCDGCVNSYHFSCLNPPLDPANPPEGQWFCPSCQTRNSFGALFKSITEVSQRDFHLPANIRNHFQGVRTGQEGKYQEVATNVRSGPRRGNRTGRADEQYLLRLFDNKGKLIVCVACGRTSNGTRPIIQCDYCPCSWHMDCVNPPLAIPPNQKPGSDKTFHNWMCPNHIDHELYLVQMENGSYAGKSRIRRPRHPRLIDVDVLPEDDEAQKLDEQESQGIVYRVSERGLKLDFIERVKRENLEAEMRSAGEAEYVAYARKKMDDLIAQATAFYEAVFPEVSVPEAESDMLSSRSVADREAIANLISFAAENRDIENLQFDKTDLLVDALLAAAPDGAPQAPTELESLQALKELIDRRIGKLTSSH